MMCNMFETINTVRINSINSKAINEGGAGASKFSKFGKSKSRYEPDYSSEKLKGVNYIWCYEGKTSDFCLT